VILAYLAHPIAGDVRANLVRYKAWLRYLQTRHPTLAFIAPSIDWIEVCGDRDDNAAERERGLARCCQVVARCDEIWLVGSRLSQGMERELAAWKRANSYDDGEAHQDNAPYIHREHLGQVTPPVSGQIGLAL
jgi:hypothetical protein